MKCLRSVRPVLAACAVFTAAAVAFSTAQAPSTAEAPTAAEGVADATSKRGASGGDPARTRQAGRPEPPGTLAALRAQRNRDCGRYEKSVCRRYATLFRRFGPKKRPRGVAATFSVHKPREVVGRHHSLVEIAMSKPGNYRTFIEVGVRRGGRQNKPHLFVFRWNRGNPFCYNRCGGFKFRGKGKKPGTVVRPGSYIRVAWRHHHHRWNLYVNGKWSGFYPDRLWNGTFHHAAPIQFFGEVSFRKDGRGRCVDMGNGRFPRYKSARVFKIRWFGTTARYKGGVRSVSAPRMYNLRRTSPRSFKYGGPGPC